MTLKNKLKKHPYLCTEDYKTWVNETEDVNELRHPLFIHQKT